MLTEMSTKVSGKMIRLTGRESTLMSMEAAMKAPGSKISNMATVLKDGLMEPPMKASIYRERSMEKESSLGLTSPPILETSMTTISTARAYTNGLMEECSQVSGATIRWRDMEPSHGLMDADMWVNISTI
jgi:hypothetical protein